MAGPARLAQQQLEGDMLEKMFPVGFRLADL
jgi:hypothetical protein